MKNLQSASETQNHFPQRLIAVTPDYKASSIELLAAQMMALEPWVDQIQIREKSRPPKMIEKLLLILKGEGFPFQKLIMNDRADIAIAFGIPTLQVTEQSLDIGRLKSAFPQLKLGRSIHALEQIRDFGALCDYCLLGHIFPTKQKSYPPFGLKRLAEARALADNEKVKLFLIGGITHQNVAKILPFADGIAQMSSLFQHPESPRADANQAGILEAKRVREVMAHFRERGAEAASRISMEIEDGEDRD